ncbi:hypothetical protein V8E54_002113 [Elaphomyces granulatus]
MDFIVLSFLTLWTLTWYQSERLVWIRRRGDFGLIAVIGILCSIVGFFDPNIWPILDESTTVMLKVESAERLQQKREKRDLGFTRSYVIDIVEVTGKRSKEEEEEEACLEKLIQALQKLTLQEKDSRSTGQELPEEKANSEQKRTREIYPEAELIEKEEILGTTLQSWSILLSRLWWPLAQSLWCSTSRKKLTTTLLVKRAAAVEAEHYKKRRHLLYFQCVTESSFDSVTMSEFREIKGVSRPLHLQ